MQELAERVGLGVVVDNNRLQFKDPVIEPRLSVRTRSSLEAVWREPSRDLDDPELYSVYWGTVLLGDEEHYRQQDIDHTYVLICPGAWQGEFFKTQGHYHLPMGANRLGHPELYHVLAGQGLFLLQHAAPPDWSVDEVCLIDVHPGSIVVVRPNDGHLTINTGAEPLVFEAFLANGLQPVTQPYQARRGGAVYCLQMPAGMQIVPNEHYSHLPAFQQLRVPNLDLASAGPFYRSVTMHLEGFSWLREPDTFVLEAVESQLRNLAGAG